MNSTRKNIDNIKNKNTLDFSEKGILRIISGFLLLKERYLVASASRKLMSFPILSVYSKRKFTQSNLEQIYEDLRSLWLIILLYELDAREMYLKEKEKISNEYKWFSCFGSQAAAREHQAIEAAYWKLRLKAYMNPSCRRVVTILQAYNKNLKEMKESKLSALSSMSVFSEAPKGFFDKKTLFSPIEEEFEAKSLESDIEVILGSCRNNLLSVRAQFLLGDFKKCVSPLSTDCVIEISNAFIDKNNYLRVDYRIAEGIDFLFVCMTDIPSRIFSGKAWWLKIDHNRTRSFCVKLLKDYFSLEKTVICLYSADGIYSNTFSLQGAKLVGKSKLIIDCLSVPIPKKVDYKRIAHLF